MVQFGFHIQILIQKQLSFFEPIFKELKKKIRKSKKKCFQVIRILKEKQRNNLIVKFHVPDYILKITNITTRGFSVLYPTDRDIQ